MNLALSDEQEFLREAARGALSRYKTVEAAREALEDGKGALPDLWSVAREAGWPGLLIDEDQGGAGLDAFDAMLVMGECGRVLAGVPLLGHLTATALLQAASDAPQLPELASGELRAAYLPTCPPGDVEHNWTVDREHGAGRAEAPTGTKVDGGIAVSGRLAFVPDAPGADILVGVALVDGEPTGFTIESGALGVTVHGSGRLRRDAPAGPRGPRRRDRHGARCARPGAR